MKIIFEPTKIEKYRTVTIEVPYDDLNIYELWNDLIRLALLAKEFAENTLDSL